ncbi:MAG: UDP-2,3-diacylglucosamine diphosphatase [Gammaproteobacteria bacterium]|nr:MAG: UDP-2,3-diacylglucosamine diphosphatase [Gammaproteobacteria bacterium]
MSETLFIADLHLDKRYPRAVAAFERYIHSLADKEIDALYILGDLFEYWLGDDCTDSTADRVATTLSTYQQHSGTPLYFIHGNRDFLLGEDFAARCRMQLLPEHYVINLYGVKTLILHGDTLCTDDVAYGQLRQTLRDPQWQRKILRWPVWLRRLKALYLRRRSQKANREKSDAIMDASPQTVAEMMQHYQVRQMIHGHTHRPALHRFILDDEVYYRSVVGDWYTQGSVLTVSAEKQQLIGLPLTEI